MPRLTCIFQTIINWHEYHCIHPKKNKYKIICDHTTVCSHREPIRHCEIAKTLLYLNVDSLERKKIKYCKWGHMCNRDKINPECSEENLREWVKKYKKDFKVEEDERA